MNLFPLSPRTPRLAFFFCCLLLSPACRSTPEVPPIMIEGLVLRNVSSAPVRSVRLQVKATMAVVSYSTIPAQREISTEFPLREYAGHSFTIEWQQNGNDYSTPPMHLELPAQVVPDLPALVLVEFRDFGVVRARLVQTHP